MNIYVVYMCALAFACYVSSSRSIKPRSGIHKNIHQLISYPACLRQAEFCRLKFFSADGKVHYHSREMRAIGLYCEADADCIEVLY